jgi:hypothetical protein
VIQSYNLFFAALEDARSLQNMKADLDKRSDDPTRVNYSSPLGSRPNKGLSGFLSEFINKAEIAVPGLQRIARESGY